MTASLTPNTDNTRYSTGSFKDVPEQTLPIFSTIQDVLAVFPNQIDEWMTDCDYSQTRTVLHRLAGELTYMMRWRSAQNALRTRKSDLRWPFIAVAGSPGILCRILKNNCEVADFPNFVGAEPFHRAADNQS